MICVAADMFTSFDFGAAQLMLLHVSLPNFVSSEYMFARDNFDQHQQICVSHVVPMPMWQREIIIELS